MPREVKVVEVRPAGPDHQVVSLQGARGDSPYLYRREPCPGCPWKCENDGSFPADAFRHSARTSEDMSTHTFACHESGKEKPAVCAGFLLRGADHNLAVRLAYSSGDLVDDVSDGGHQLHPSYRAMAEANGVPKDDPALAKCRD